MIHYILGELLVAFLLFVVSVRIFFIKKERRDELALLSVVAFVVIVLHIIAWNVDFVSAILFVASAFTLLNNINAISRSINGLYIDHYRVLFICNSIVVIVLSTIIMVAIALYFPVIIDAKNYDVTETRIGLSGSFEKGFRKSSYFEISNGYLYLYEPIAEKKSNTVVLLCSDKRADALAYRPYMILLSQKGYTVISCDFYSKEVKWFDSILNMRYFRKLSMMLSYLKNQSSFSLQKDFYTFGITKEFSEMKKIAIDMFGSDTKFFLVCDGMADIAAAEIAKQSNDDDKIGVLALDSVTEYRTQGFGLIEQTDPLFAQVFRIKRDKTLSTPKALVEETLKKIY